MPVGALSVCNANAQEVHGVTEKEIKIGQSMPYSGPGSHYSTIARANEAYFRMVNENGGVNGRKITLISLDDAYSPPKTVEQTRRLVEQDDVLLIFDTLGTATNAAIQKYCICFQRRERPGSPIPSSFPGPWDGNRTTS